MANPRKFSEKIALHNQKQAEETAAFEQIMREVMGATRNNHGQENMQGYATSYDSSYIQQAANGAYSKHQLSISPSLGAYRGGSLPNVNQMSGGPAHSIDLQGALSHLEDMRQGREASAVLPDRPHVRERGRHATAPHKGRQMAFDKRADVSPYSSSLYLSPPPDSSWRRTNSDSALHQSAQTPQENFPGVGPACGQRRGTDPVTARELDQMYRDCSTRVDGFGQEIMGMQDMNSMAMDGMNMKGYWDPKGGGGGDCYGNSLSSMGCGISTQQQHQQHQQHRPKSCDVPGINIYLPQDESGDGTALASSPGAAGGPPQGAGGPGAGSLQAPPMGNGNTGSLPDLTSLHFPPPLATPLDPSEELAHQQQGASPGPPSLPPLHPGQSPASAALDSARLLVQSAYTKQVPQARHVAAPAHRGAGMRALALRRRRRRGAGRTITQPAWCWDPAVACTGRAGSSLPRWAHPPGKALPWTQMHFPWMDMAVVPSRPSNSISISSSINNSISSSNSISNINSSSNISSWDTTNRIHHRSSARIPDLLWVIPPHHLPYPKHLPVLGLGSCTKVVRLHLSGRAVRLHPRRLMVRPLLCLLRVPWAVRMGPVATGRDLPWAARHPYSSRWNSSALQLAALMTLLRLLPLQHRANTL
ncbi:uncharacterized protein LOC119159495 isoform X7 [Rhipicephalus microplus]|uniref:uncharacterized protein LOC119159495 isoform X7 n=1 Tax=Rhipicephalus microplus TaxID=6941 RepID=UPI003F6BDA46